MVDKTILTRSDVETILLHYDLGTVEEFSLIKKGCVHSNYILVMSLGTFVLRVYEERTMQQIILEMKLLEELSTVDVPTPETILTKEKTTLLEYAGKRIAIFTFMDGEHVEDRQANMQQIKSVGHNMGLFHKALVGFTPEEVEYKQAYDKNYVLDLLRQLQVVHFDFPHKYEQFILDTLEMIDVPDTLPKGLNHGDMHGDNVFFKGDTVSAILDFDDCFYGPLLMDLGSLIAFWCVNEDIDFSKCRALLESYGEHRTISDDEKKYLFEATQLFMLIHAIYWLWDENDWRDDIQPFKVLRCLDKVGKEKFYSGIFG